MEYNGQLIMEEDNENIEDDTETNIEEYDVKSRETHEILINNEEINYDVEDNAYDVFNITDTETNKYESEENKPVWIE